MAGFFCCAAGVVGLSRGEPIMLAPAMVNEVQRLLTDGELSQRQIARLTGVSRGTVGSIASGKRPDYETLRRSEETDWEEPAGPPERCPGCGGMVYMPCRLCHAMKSRGKLARSSRKVKMVLSDVSCQLDLRPDHRVRYEEVRNWREARAAMEPLEGNVAGLAVGAS
jgi:transcriptional regulator with XRE-family HTH domain